MMVDKIKAQNETSTSQKFTNLQIVGDLQPTDHNIPVADDGRCYLPKDLLQFGG